MYSQNEALKQAFTAEQTAAEEKAQAEHSEQSLQPRIAPLPLRLWAFSSKRLVEWEQRFREVTLERF